MAQTAQGDVSGGTTLETYRYTVVSNTAWSYTSMDTTSKEKCYFCLGCVITAQVSATNDAGETTWVKITSVVSGTTSSSGAAINSYMPMSDTGGEVFLEKGTKAVTTTASDEDSTTTETYLDDNFAVTYYTTYDTVQDYVDSLKDGLTISDIRGVMGMPHQFLPSVDPRIDGTTNINVLGRTYSQFIVKKIPLLLMTPGVANFMTSFNDNQRNLVKGALLNIISDDELKTLLDGTSGKYYSLKYSYTDYFYYVNAMLRSAAYFLGIEGTVVDGQKLGSMNWLYYSNNDDNSDIFGSEGLKKFLGPYAGCIAFYANPGNTVDDSFSNSTTTSQLASSLNSLSDQGRELNFLIGNVGSLSGIDLTNEQGLSELNESLTNITDQVDDVLGNGNILSNILNKANTILAGGRIVFPEIWSDSSFGRSYSCSMKLVAGAGDKLSVFLDVLVPIYHLLAFALPRQSNGGQAYYSPFLIRAYCQGAFNVDMGIMTSLSITKGAEGEWTVDGLPTVADISFDIKDLYEGMFMSKQETVGSYSDVMSNITELDYIANSCGVNINDQEVIRTIRMYVALGFTGALKDTIEIGIFGGITQYFNQKLNDIFGVF